MWYYVVVKSSFKHASPFFIYIFNDVSRGPVICYFYFVVMPLGPEFGCACYFFIECYGLVKCGWRCSIG